MVTKGLFFLVMSMVLLFVTCNARHLKGFIQNSEEHNVLVATASISALELPEVSGIQKRAPVLDGGEGTNDNARDDGLEVKGNYKKDKYMKLRALVLASLPKGTKRSPSSTSKRHNDFNA